MCVCVCVLLYIHVQLTAVVVHMCGFTPVGLGRCQRQSPGACSQARLVVAMANVYSTQLMYVVPIVVR